MNKIPDLNSPDEHENDLFAFFERLKTMSSIRRFGTLPMVQGETVAGHSYNVAMFALMIADHEEDPSIDKALLLRKALLHDFEESLLSDIPHPVKHKFKRGKLNELLKQIVPELIDREIFKELPANLQAIYKPAALDAKDGREGEMVRVADAMDIVLTAIRELKLGNQYFERIFEVGMSLLEAKGKDFKFSLLFMEAAKIYRHKKVSTATQLDWEHFEEE